MRVLCEMVESHELSQAMLAQMTVGLASDKNAAANTNDTKYAYATALFVQVSAVFVVGSFLTFRQFACRWISAQSRVKNVMLPDRS